MAEEPIIFPVSAPGTEDVIAAFQALGLTAQEAAFRVQRSQDQTKLTTQQLAAQADLLALAMGRGVVNTDALIIALQKMTGQQLQTRALMADTAASLEAYGQSQLAVYEQITVASSQATKQVIADIYAMDRAVLQSTDLRFQAMLEEEKAYSDAQARMAASAREATTIRVMAALEEEKAISATAAKNAASAAEATNIRMRAALEEEQAVSAAAAARAEAVRAADAAMAASAREATNLRILAALEEETAVGAAAKAEADAVLAAQARLAASAREASNLRVLAALDEEQAVAKAMAAEAKAAADADAARAASARTATNIRVQAALEEEQAFSAAEARMAASAREATNLRVLAAMEEETAVAAAAKAQADAVITANERIAASAREAANIRVLAALEEEQTVSKAMTAEAATATEADTRRAASAREATNLRMLAALEEQKAFSAAEAATTAAAVAGSNLRFLALLEEEKATVQLTVAQKQLAAAIAGVKEAFSGVQAVFGNVWVQLTGFITAAAAFKDIDIAQKLNTQLQSVTGSAEAGNAVFQKLFATAQATAQPIETVSRTFAQLDAVLKEQGLTTDQVATATDTLSKIMRGTAVSGENSVRVFHELQEIVSGSANAGRAWNSIYALAPALAAKLANILGYDLANAHGKQTAAVDRAQAAVDAFNHKVEHSAGSVTGATNAYEGNVRSLQHIRNEHQILTTHSTLSAAAQARYNLAVKEGTEKVNESRQRMDEAREAEDKANQIKKDALDTRLRNAKAMSDEGTAMKLITQSAQDEANAANAVAEKNVTIHESFTRLNNAFIEYVKTSGDAGAASHVLASVLGTIGNNIHIIVPLAIMLGIIWAGWKLAEMAVGAYDFAKAIYNIATSTRAAAIATALYDAALTPTVAAFVVFTAMMLAAAGHMGVFDGAIASAKNALASFRDAMFGSAAYADTLKAAVDKASSSMGSSDDIIQKLTGSLGKQDDIIQTLHGDTGDYVTVLGKAHKAANDNMMAVYDENKAYDAQIHTMHDLAAAVGAVSLAKKLAGNAGPVPGVNQPVNPGGDYDNSYFNKPDYKGYDYGGAHGTSYARFARDGASFTVPGSGGVDSVPMWVSPGEHVTVQTPQQAQHGIIPKFRDGGTLDLTGVGVTFAQAAQQSTAGYTAPTGYTTSGAAVAAAQAAATVADAASNVIQAGSRFALGNGTDVTGTSSDPYKTANDHAIALAKKASALTADLRAISAARVITAIDGVGKPTSSIMTQAQAEKWIEVNGQFVGRAGNVPGINTYAGDVTAATMKYNDDSLTPAYRDGGGFMVPGSGGVDSNIVRMAVSPGEEVTVKTPQQRMAAQRSGGGIGAPVVNMTVYTQDANSFGQSQAQLLDATKRKMARL